MTFLALAFVLTSALMHAAWNAIVKAGSDRLISGWATTAAGAAFGLVVLAAAGLPPARSLPFIFSSGALHAAYMVALTRAYDHGELSLVYPIARGVAPVLATAGALAAFHERLPDPAYAGIGLITLGVLLLGFLSHRAAADSASRIASAIGWSLLAAATIAAYTLTDRQGVRLASPASYIGVLFLVLTGFLTAFVAMQRGNVPWHLIPRSRWGPLALSGAFSVGAYLLVLAALSVSRVGYIAALRETSVLLAAWVGWRHLGDPQGARRVVSSGLVALGLVILIAAR
jgi:uncharacterized membrane protein